MLSMSSTAFLNVISKPTVILLPTYILIEHETARLRCGLTVQNLTVQWLKNGVDLPSTTK